MEAPERGRAEAASPADLAATGDRIEALLEASATAGPLARERAEELVRLVVDLYGAGLERLLEILHDSGHLDDDLADRLAADDLVSSLLVVHGLHPYDLATRVVRALDEVRPRLGTHGRDVEVVAVGEDGVVRLRMPAGCDRCGSEAVIAAAENAVRTAAPEVTGVEIEQARPEPELTLISVSALRSRLESGAAGRAGPAAPSAPALARTGPT